MDEKVKHELELYLLLLELKLSSQLQWLDTFPNGQMSKREREW